MPCGSGRGGWSIARSQYWTITAVGYAVNLLAVPLLALRGQLGGRGGADCARAGRKGAADTRAGRHAVVCDRAHRSRVGLRPARGAGPGRRDARAARRHGGRRQGRRLPARVRRAARARARGARHAGRWRGASFHLRARSSPFRRHSRRAASRDATGCTSWGAASSPPATPTIPCSRTTSAVRVPCRSRGFPPCTVSRWPWTRSCALVAGRWFDRVGMRALVVTTIVSAFFAPLALGDRSSFAVAGVVLWGVGMGAQESIVRAAVAAMTPRGSTRHGVRGVQSRLRGRMVRGHRHDGHGCTAARIAAVWLFSVGSTARRRAPVHPCLSRRQMNRALPQSIHGLARGDTRWRLPSHACSCRSSSERASSLAHRVDDAERTAAAALAAVGVNKGTGTRTSRGCLSSSMNPPRSTSLDIGATVRISPTAGLQDSPRTTTTRPMARPSRARCSSRRHPSPAASRPGEPRVRPAVRTPCSPSHPG